MGSSSRVEGSVLRVAPSSNRKAGYSVIPIPVSYYNPLEETSPKFAFAFARGCRGSITDELDLFPGPVALFGSPSRWPVLRKAQAEGRDYFYADHGYHGRRTFYRITKNGYQHDGRGTAPNDRFEFWHRPIQPWRKSGGHVLVCPNSAVYFNLFGLDVQAWLNNVVDTIRQFTDREIRIRWKVQSRATHIREDLVNCWAVVVFSSAAALDALLAGVPVFVLAPFAAGARMGLSDVTQIESPLYPDDRESFFAVLAYQQWTLMEIFRGVAWRSLQENPCAA